MAGKHINVPVVIFSSLLLVLLMISVVSSFSADHNHPLEYQNLVPTLLSTRPETELDTLSWDTQSESEPKYSRSLSLKLHHVDNLIMSSHHQGGKITSESLFDIRLQRDALRTKLILATITKSAANRQFSSPVISGLEWGSGEYFTRIGVGTPSRDFYMVMDTGSHIIWLQCLPCKKCYKQADKIFNPKNSKSFRGGVPCKSKICDNNGTTSGHCLHNLKRCAYNISYGDGSFSSGQVVTETLTFGRRTKVPNVIIGCGHDNEGLLVAAAGLIGLARDRLSFPGQAGRKFGNKFSYCLANRLGWPSSNKSKSSSSYLIFGDSTACGKAVYTPLVKNPILDVLNMFYYVGLEGISVGGSRVHGINASTFDFDSKTGGGGVIVDSGTSVTRLTNHAYLALRNAFRKGTKHLKRAASKYSLLDTCYYLSGMSEVKVPTVELHFHGGVSMSVPAANLMIPVDNKKTYCFAFAGTADSDGGLSISVIGNIQQQGLGMVFDLANKRLGFAENAC